jgi:hypothetical protein
MTLTARPRRTLGRPTATLLLLMTCLALPAIGATAIATAAPTRHARHTTPARHHTTAFAARTFPRALALAAAWSTQADRSLVSEAKTLTRCLRENRGHPRRCNAARRAVQRGGTKLAKARQRLARIARATGKTTAGSRSLNTQRAPVLTVSGQTLSWTRVANIKTYVLMSRVPHKSAQYSVISGTSITPPPVPGVTVQYSVRTTANGSAWSTEQSITYAPAPETVDMQAAPVLTVAGQTLTWSAIANVGTYVLATNVPGAAAQYSVVSGTSITPPSVPGVTVRYSIRTAVNGSTWSPEVSISYPAGAKQVTPPPSSGGASGGFEMGAVVGSAVLWELPWIEKLGAHTARMEFDINSPVSKLEPVMEAYAKAGIRPLLLAVFDGRLPSPAEAQNLASWAAAFGPGGSFWQGKNLPASAAVTDIEFGNETSYSYQFPETANASNWYELPSFVARAQTYALRFKAAQTAIQAANPNVGLLAQGTDGGSGAATWVNNMFAAVPDLAQRVAGWTIHPYGPDWQSEMDRLISQTSAVGAPSNIPIYVTEWGLSTDNGRCLSENFGFNRCMSYGEAASTVTSSVAAMRSKYGSRLRAFYLFQGRDQEATGASSNREGYCGALQSNDTPKGAYTSAVQSLLAANP